ncbi:hypothetical protein MRB53_000461 [Persea americana]|uniref:Uncharacterized protein n=1 Tax=Persea americana TaxID=3435 RepID=A0ACC2MP83_PERAE|nr:hypothetical protein MRB53_000461 [Persea americana]
MEEEPDYYRMPPEDLRCSYRDEASTKGKTGSQRKRGRNEDDEEEKEVIPERKARQKLEEMVEMKIEEEADLDYSNADKALKRRGRKPAK